MKYIHNHHMRGKTRPDRRRFTDEQEAEICTRYLAGVSTTVLCKDYGMHRQVAWGVLRRNDIDVLHSGLTDDAKDEALRLYQEGVSSPILARRLGVNSQTIRNLLESRGIARRDGNRRYDHDPTFFDVIDSEAKAYWLGFIGADGCISVERGELSFSLKASDRDQLDAFCVAIKSDHPVRVGTTHIGDTAYGYCQFSIRSVGLVRGLVRHGVTPRKSLTHEWPDGLTTDLLQHYLRGYFDGDGCFHVSKKNRYSFAASMLGTEWFLQAAHSFLLNSCGIGTRCRVCQTHNKAYRLSYGGRLQVQRFAQFLYRDATVYLPRKRQIVAHLL